MNEVILFVGLFLGNLTVTSYRSIPEQTDGSPNATSIGERTHKGGCAVSRDLLDRWGGPIAYGDYLYIENLGIYKVNDVMGLTVYDKATKRRYKIKKHIDIWVGTRAEEVKIGLIIKKVYVIKRSIS